MFCNRTSNYRYAFQFRYASVAIMLVASLSSGSVFAQKGGTGHAGVAYYQTTANNLPGTTGYVKADGTGNVVTVRNGGPPLIEASHAIHGGQRWFLVWESSVVAAAPEQGNPVTLFYDPNFTILDELHWVRSTNDSWISFPGRLESTNPTTGARETVEEGIYRLQIAYDTSGNIIGSVPGTFQQVLSTRPMVVTGHDWSPTGALLFITRNTDDSTAMWIASFSNTGQPTVVPVNTGSVNRVSQPGWSPDGTKIAFTEHPTGIVIITLANGQRKIIRNGATSSVYRPQWSPDGKGIVYQNGSFRTYVVDVYRANADGSGKTFLATGRSLGWRQ